MSPTWTTRPNNEFIPHAWRSKKIANSGGFCRGGTQQMGSGKLYSDAAERSYCRFSRRPQAWLKPGPGTGIFFIPTAFLFHQCPEEIPFFFFLSESMEVYAAHRYCTYKTYLSHEARTFFLEVYMKKQLYMEYKEVEPQSICRWLQDSPSWDDATTDLEQIFLKKGW